MIHIEKPLELWNGLVMERDGELRQFGVATLGFTGTLFLLDGFRGAVTKQKAIDFLQGWIDGIKRTMPEEEKT